ncbi:MAG: hypothetical protein ACRDTM_01310 [Micromonosporaceae bacterium]
MRVSVVAAVDVPPPAPDAAPGLIGNTPRRLGAWLVALVLLALVTGLVGGYQIDDRSSVVDDVALRSGALSTTELALYQSLSDADATAASAFLAGGLEPPKLRQRYENAIARASAALATAADGAPAEQSATITELSVNLPVYTGLVERARAYNRQRLPLGAAYLRQASSLMRETLLPAAQKLYQDEARRLDAAQRSADGGLWLTLLLVVVLLGGLAWAQRELTGRTNRVFNRGLLVATAATLVAGIWLGVATFAAAGHMDASRRDGAAQLALLAEARIVALQARSDEAMTLIARGGGAEFEEHYTDEIKRLVGLVGDSGLLAEARKQATEDQVRDALDEAIATARQWRAVHSEVREADNAGNYNDAVTKTIGDAPDSAGSLAGKLDAQLARAIGYASARFHQEAARARGALYGVGYALGVLMLITAVGIAVGLQRRIREYR